MTEISMPSRLLKFPNDKTVCSDNPLGFILTLKLEPIFPNII